MECVRKTITEYWKTIVDETTAGSFSVNLSDGIYRITLVGAGGGGAGASDAPRDYKACEAGGGSGSYVRALIRLTDGNYSATVGVGGDGAGGLYGTFVGATGGNSSFGSYITAYGGTGGIARWTDGTGGNPTGGTGGALPSITGVESVLNSLAGSNGGIHQQAGTAVGGSNPTEYGKGGDAFCSGGTAVGYKGGDGYVKIERLSDKNSYDVAEQRVIHQLPKISNKFYGIEHFHWNNNGTPQ